MKACPHELLWKPKGGRVRINNRPIVRRPSWIRRLPPGVHALEFVSVLRIDDNGAWLAVGDPARRMKTLAPIYVANPF